MFLIEKVDRVLNKNSGCGCNFLSKI